MILLVRPSCFSLTLHPPLGLGYLASSLARAGRRARILDLEFPGDRRALDEIVSRHALDWVGLSISLQNLAEGRTVAEMIRRHSPGIPLVIGGTVPSTEPERSLAAFGADVAVLGEGEETVIELDRALQSGSPLTPVPGLVVREGARLVRTGRRPWITRLDDLPIPDHAQIPPARYSIRPWQIVKRGRLVGSVLTSRGCPFHCAFCAAPAILGRQWRRRSPDLVGDEIAHQCRSFGVDEIHVVDDNLAGSREHAAGFCEAILARGLRIHWKTPNGLRAEHLDGELIALMKRSGCYMLGFGIESGSPEVLRRAGKPLDLALVLDRIRLARKHGIATFAYFIIGFPWDTRETIEETTRMAVGSGADLAHFSFCVPLPGSRIFAEMPREAQRQARENAWFFLPIAQGSVPERELRRLQRRAYARFYLNPRGITRLARIVGPSEVPALARAAAFYLAGRWLGPRGPRSGAASAREPLPTGASLDLVMRARRLVEGGFGTDRTVVERFAIRAGGRVLDVGSGESPFADLVSRKRYLGIDASPAWVAAARRRHPDHAFLAADFLDDPNLEGPFALILVSKVLHHLDDDWASRLLARAASVLGDGGSILVLEPTPPTPGDTWIHRLVCRWETGRHHRSAEGLAALLPAGFAIRETAVYKTRPMRFYFARISLRPSS